jgi:starch synthase
MKILYIAAECKPFSKVGGVADVAGELPVAIRQMGVDIEIVTPLYEENPGPLVRQMLASNRPVQYGFPFRTKENSNGQETVDVYKWEPNRDYQVPVHLVKNTTYFGGRYGKPYIFSEYIPYYDDALRFSFFSEACLQIIKEKQPDLVHINDWPLGYLFGRMAMEGFPQKRVLTIHNIGYQGNIGIETIRGSAIEQILNDPQAGPHFLDPHQEWNSVNALRLGLELSDRVNTVSPTYAREIMEPEDQSRYFEGGKGLEATVRKLAEEDKLAGILNGFGYNFEPDEAAFDRILARKAEMKAALSRDFTDPQAFLLGFVGRAVEQKFKLLSEQVNGKSVLEHILDLPGVNVAIVTSGLPEYENFLLRLKDIYARNLSLTLAFDKTKAEQISLGSDIFLMPSLFEPCGITQMESLANATPPLVRWTGGLVDTVQPYTRPDGTGFGFDGSTRDEVLRNLIETVREALAFFTNRPKKFKELQRRGFNQRFTWATAASEYIDKLYRPTE